MLLTWLELSGPSSLPPLSTHAALAQAGLAAQGDAGPTVQARGCHRGGQAPEAERRS